MSLIEFMVLVPFDCCVVDTCWLSQKAPDAPDSHHRVKNDGRPQADADRLRLNACSAEDNHCAEIIQNHRADQSPRGTALRVVLREPAGDAQCEQRRAGYARESHRPGNIEMSRAAAPLSPMGNIAAPRPRPIQLQRSRSAGVSRSKDQVIEKRRAALASRPSVKVI